MTLSKQCGSIPLMFHVRNGHGGVAELGSRGRNRCSYARLADVNDVMNSDLLPVVCHVISASSLNPLVAIEKVALKASEFERGNNTRAADVKIQRLA